MEPVIIVGAGISGLSAAYYLAKSAVPSTLIELRPRLGGLIQTEHVGGCLIEAGPDSFLAAKPWAADLIRELGLESELIGSNDRLRKTFVWRAGRLVPLPDGLHLMVPTRILPILRSRLLSWPTRARMALEWFRAPAKETYGDRSVADFIEDHYGAEAVEYLAEPLLAGIYGGDARELGVASVLPQLFELEVKYGSLTRGVWRGRAAGASNVPLFRTLKGGLRQLVEALRPATGCIHKRAEALERYQGGFRVRIDGDWLAAREVVLACEAHQAARLLQGLEPALAGLLRSIPYSSSTTVALGFDRRAIRHPLDGFGFLVPRRERRKLIACTWVSTKFAHRVPPGKVLLRAFVAGSDESEEALVAATLEELRDMMGIFVPPLFWRVWRWPNSMPQYTVGYQDRLVEIEARLKLIPGLYLAGNAYHGIGIPDCIRMGKQVAQRIASGS